MTAVEKLEALLARVQKNRAVPRVIPSAEPVRATPTAAAPTRDVPLRIEPEPFEAEQSSPPLELALDVEPVTAPHAVPAEIAPRPPSAPPVPEPIAAPPAPPGPALARAATVEPSPPAGQPREIRPDSVAPPSSAIAVQVSGESTAFRPPTFGELLTRTLSLKPR